MRVRIDIGLDFEGNHTFDWQPSEAAGAVEVPRATLDRWSSEREAFKLAYLRWKRVVEEVEDTLLRADERRRGENGDRPSDKPADRSADKPTDRPAAEPTYAYAGAGPRRIRDPRT